METTELLKESASPPSSSSCSKFLRETLKCLPVFCVLTIILVALILVTVFVVNKRDVTSPDIVNDTIPNIIFETDMGNDVDDALALDLIYKYLDEGKVNLLAIGSNKNTEYSTEYIHLMNNWYGYPNIPIGKVVNGVHSESDGINYCEHVCHMKNNDGNPLFERPAFDYDAIPEAVTLYRQILSNQEDYSVTVLSTGFSTNLARLLDSPPDRYSGLNGRELIERKVRYVSAMAGSFGDALHNATREFNVVRDIPAAQAVASRWPTPVVYTPYEAGNVVLYPAGAIEYGYTWADHHPVVEAYRSYREMPYDRPMWDVIATLYVLDGATPGAPLSDCFTQSANGTVTVDEEGLTVFVPNGDGGGAGGGDEGAADGKADGTRAYLRMEEGQPQRMLERLIKTTTRPPRRYRTE